MARNEKSVHVHCRHFDDDLLACSVPECGAPYLAYSTAFSYFDIYSKLRGKSN